MSKVFVPNKEPPCDIIGTSKYQKITKGVFLMLRLEPKQPSVHSLLYNRIPKNYILKLICEVVDFSFINELLADCYSEFGRPAKEPEMMCKLLFLEHLYNLSDEEILIQASINLGIMYFIGLNPEDPLPERSLLSKFRRHRLGEERLDLINTEIIRQCTEKGIIHGKSIVVDATHTEANTIKKTPERLMKHLGRNIMNTYTNETGHTIENMPTLPNYEEIPDHQEAKLVMKGYLDTVIEQVEKQLTGEEKKTDEALQKAKQIVEDPKFIHQKGIRSLVDEDARVGRKSKTQDFYGYKTEIMMTTEDRIITSVRTADGAYTDGSFVKEMLEETLKGGIKIEEVYGDKGYFRKPILEDIHELNAQPYIPVSESVYRIDESEYSYNKDSDEWQCSQGNTTVKKKYYKTKRGEGIREGYKYYFEMNQCKACPLHDLCAKQSARRILSVGLNTTEFYEISQYQKTDEFKEKYKKRACIEGKNAELKRFHGLSRARGYGLLSMSIQAKLTVIAVNLKRIAAIVSSFLYCFSLKTLLLYLK